MFPEMKMDDDFPYVDYLPKLFRTSPLIEREGIRWYTQHGSWQEFYHWYRIISEAYSGNLIPLQYVPEFVGVSRASVHKRAKNGGLTIFSFVVTERKHTILGTRKDRDTKKRYDMTMLSECQEWYSRLLDRASRSEIDYPGLEEIAQEEQ